MSPHPVLTERAAYRALPSVVTWFQPSNLLNRATRVPASHAQAYPTHARPNYALPEDESDLDVDVEAEELRVSGYA